MLISSGADVALFVMWLKCQRSVFTYFEWPKCHRMGQGHGVVLLIALEVTVLMLLDTQRCRDEAARLWNQREQEWNRERQAREKLMKDVSRHAS